MQGRVASLVDLSAGFHRDLTGRENLLIGGVLLGLTRDEVRERLRRDHRVQRPRCRKCSTGRSRRTRRGWACDSGSRSSCTPRRTCCSSTRCSPWATRRFQRQCVDRVESLRAGGTAVMLVSHDMTLVRPAATPCSSSTAACPSTWAIRPPPIARHLDAPLGEEDRRPAGRARAVRDVVAGPGRTTAARVSGDARTARVRSARARSCCSCSSSASSDSERSARSFGVVWPIIAPLLLLVLYTFVFGRVFDVPGRRLPGLPVRGAAAVDVPRAVDPRRPAEHLVRAGSRAGARRSPTCSCRSPGSSSWRSRSSLLLVVFVVWYSRRRPTTCRSHSSRLLVIPVFSVVLHRGDAHDAAGPRRRLQPRTSATCLNNIFTVWFFLAPIVYTKRMTRAAPALHRVDGPDGLGHRAVPAAPVLGRADQRLRARARPRRVDRDLRRGTRGVPTRDGRPREVRLTAAFRRREAENATKCPEIDASRVSASRSVRGSTRSSRTTGSAPGGCRSRGARGGRTAWHRLRTPTATSAPAVGLRRASPLPRTAPGRCGPRPRAATRCATGSTGCAGCRA